MYEINIADKKMLREMVREAMEKGGLGSDGDNVRFKGRAKTVMK